MVVVPISAKEGGEDDIRRRRRTTKTEEGHQHEARQEGEEVTLAPVRTKT